MLTSSAVSLLLLIGLVHLWPSGERPSFSVRDFDADASESIRVDDIQPTRQEHAVPAPPAPPIPVVVPNDYVLEDAPLEFSSSLVIADEVGPDAIQSRGDTATPTAPTIGPRTVRFVEPEYTREARKRRIRAELVVRVLVNERGSVEESIVVERFLLAAEGDGKTPVNVLGFGLEEAALSAADRWMFRPASKNGTPVASQALLTFTFGVDS